ncbi:hypothetical protein QE382_003882 [Sphingobacterium zeae]|uniref:Uncharacterized protein n=1 Tax=Sphingobacterium zeae TaxID=1776859 RepID=A0ABU0UAL4_9SPHI|nr:hypothetical protein [Sphingobacterium zeae]
MSGNLTFKTVKILSLMLMIAYTTQFIAKISYGILETKISQLKHFHHWKRENYVFKI